jgi:predicted nucleic acid-binding protein
MDACCWNRPFDFLSHDEIYLEAVSIWKILSICKDEWEVVASDIIDVELSKMHLATAEIGQCDIFLTTDRDLLNTAKNMNLAIRVLNPVKWYFGGTE